MLSVTEGLRNLNILPTPSLETAANKVANRAYRKIAHWLINEQTEVHQAPKCFLVIDHMVKYWGNKNTRRYGPMERQYCQGWEAGWGIKSPYRDLAFHEYTIFRDQGKIADPTWQQFLVGAGLPVPQEAPKMLFGTIQEVVEQAQNYGLTDPHILNFWHQAAPALQPKHPSYTPNATS